MIGYKILEQNYEKVRNAIAAILLTEFTNQFDNFYNTDCDISEIWLERSTPIDTTEIIMVNVSFAMVPYDQWATSFVAGVCTYYVDFWAKGKGNSDDSIDGDELSAIKVQRLMGIGRAILENPIYKTLGFVPGSIGNIRVSEMHSGSMKKAENDMSNVKVGRLTLQVKVSENVPLPEGELLTSAISQLRLGLTGKGYRYVSGNDGPNPPLNSKFVYVRNKDTGEVLYMIEGGHYYDVTVLKKIIDTIISNQTTIIDNIIP